MHIKNHSKDRNEEYEGNEGNEKEVLRNSTKRKIRSMVPMIAMMILIYCFSAQTATVSGTNSYHIAEKIVEVSSSIFPKTQPYWDTIEYSTLDFIIRKLAHCTEYAVLGMCIFFHLWYTYQPIRKCRLKTISIGVFYAGTDEFHQLFVEGRSGQIRDVGIDSLGVVLGILIFSWILFMVNRHREKKVVE